MRILVVVLTLWAGVAWGQDWVEVSRSQAMRVDVGDDEERGDCVVEVVSREVDGRECPDAVEFIQGLKRVNPPRIKCGRPVVKCPVP